jgi:hypothetical protein
VHVVLSANVFVGAVRAVALGVAAARDVVVRPSSREAVLVPLLRRALEDQGSETRFALTDQLGPSPGDHVHVYGRRETIAAIAAQGPAGVVVRGHGPGFGAALLDRAADLDEAAERLSWDVIAFDQRGCMSPRIAFIVGAPDAARRFALRLASALDVREKEVPRGKLAADERRDAALYRQTAQAIGELHEGATFAVSVDFDPVAMILPPPGRHVHIARVSDIEALGRLVAPFRGAITCFGVPEKTVHAAFLMGRAPGARTLPLGNMQRPPLDGPVDLREML